MEHNWVTVSGVGFRCTQCHAMISAASFDAARTTPCCPPEECTPFAERHWQAFLAALTACANDGYSKWADLINDCNNIADEAMRRYRTPQDKSDG